MGRAGESDPMAGEGSMGAEMENNFLQWLKSIGLESYADVFRANDIDLESIAYLKESDFSALGLSLGHRRRIMAAIEALAGKGEGGEAADAPAPRPRRTEAERRLLTVLFIDIVESTQMADKLDPEALHEVIRQYQTAVTAAVVRYDGYVAKFLGDGVVAYFGWPRAHEDEAERAVRAARDAFTAIKTHKSLKRVNLRARAGVASGEVVVGDIVGEFTTDDAAAIGATPGMADRLQRFARPFEVTVSPTTKRLMGGAFELENLGTHELKGFADPIRIWRVSGDSKAVTRFDASHRARLTALVGRDSELALLRDRWEQAKTGEGQTVFISGEAGIGKSRVVEEFRRHMADDPRFGMRYQCSPHRTNNAFHPVVQQLRAATGIADEDKPAAKIEKIETLARLTAPNLKSVVPWLASLLRVPTGEAYPPIDVPPQQQRQRTIACLVDHLLSLSDRQPALMVVEDAHWADHSMLDYVEEVMRAIEGRPVMLLVTHRPEMERPWPDLAHATSITLDRVDREQSAGIVRAVAGQMLDGAAVKQVVQRAEGVPLYLEELTKAIFAMESGANYDATLVPTTLQSSLVARLDSLGEAKTAAQMGAVLGREFSGSLLSELVDWPAEALSAAVEKLVEAGLVVRRGSSSEATYSFKHALIQDAAYATLLVSQRQALHGKVIEILEDRHCHKEPGLADLLGYHALRAEDWLRAFRYFKQAAQDAIGRFALREGVGQYEQALIASKSIPDSPEISSEITDLMFELRNALWALGRFQQILTHLDDAERLAVRMGDSVRLGWVAVYRSASLWQLGRSDESKAACERGLEIARESGVRDLDVAANFYLGCAYVTSGECRMAEQYFERVVEALPGALAVEKCGLPFAPSIIARSWLVWSYAERGEFALSDENAREAIALAEGLSQPFNQAHIYYDVGYAKIVSGDLDGAIAALDDSFSLIEKWGLTYLSPFTMGFLGHALVEAGQQDRGLPLLEEACARYDKIGLGLFKSLVFMQLAHAYLRADRLAEASSTLDRAMQTARGRGERGHEAYGMLVQALLAAATGQQGMEDATRCLENALERAEGLELAPLVARCHLAYAKILADADSDEGRQHLTTARQLFDRLGVRSADGMEAGGST